MSRLSSIATHAGFETTLVAGLVFLMVFVATADIPIANGDEARFAQAAREMYERGDHIVPTFGGHDRFDKPILIYWLTITSYELFGVTPRAARLPSNLAAALTAALLAWWARRRWGPGSGVVAGLMLGASPVFFVQARACTADGVNMLWITLAMLSLERLLGDRATRGTAALFWVAVSLGLLTKGPVILVFVAATPLCQWIITRRWQRWQLVLGAVLLLAGIFGAGALVLVFPAFAAALSIVGNPKSRDRIASFGFLWGIPLLLLITLPWATLAWRATEGAFFRVAVGHHVVERSAAALEGHGGFPGFYLVTITILGFPWVASLLTNIGSAWTRRVREPRTAFLLAWIVGPLLVFELLGTKLVHYWMPSYPGVILLVVSCVWDRRDGMLHHPRAWGFVHAWGGLTLSSVPIVVVGFFGLDNLLIPAVLCALLLAGPTIWSVVDQRRHPRRALELSVIATAGFLVVLFAGFVPALSREFVSIRTIDRVSEIRQLDEALVLHRLRDEELLFHLPQDLEVTRSFEELDARIRTGQSCLMIVRRRDYDDVARAVDKGRLTIVDEIEGIDLGRGRRAKNLLLRTTQAAATP